MQQPINGIDRVESFPTWMKDARLALVTNDAARNVSGRLSRQVLLDSDYSLVKLFSPEHGIDLKGEDGQEQQSKTDAITGLPVISLYGDQMQPLQQDLQDVDAVLFDIPDVGSRFYTYLWTMTYVMEACSLYKKPLVVLDRPNPTGGRLAKAEGPMLDEENCQSFIGRWRIPIRHCCTLGELAQYFNYSQQLKVELTIIKCNGWEGRTSWLQHPEWFYPTSPAIQHIETACIYPGTAFWEGINLHDGRDTGYPFRWFGAPWINDSLFEWLEHHPLPGLAVNPLWLQPSKGKYKNCVCVGGLLSIVDEEKHRPVAAGLKLLQAIAQLYPAQIAEATYPTHANPSGIKHLDLLLGIPNAFDDIVSGKNIDTSCQQEWQRIMAPHLLY
jgi:uncharacterized protein YbbC (DUF1343 family)